MTSFQLVWFRQKTKVAFVWFFRSSYLSPCLKRQVRSLPSLNSKFMILEHDTRHKNDKITKSVRRHSFRLTKVTAIFHLSVPVEGLRIQLILMLLMIHPRRRQKKCGVQPKPLIIIKNELFIKPSHTFFRKFDRRVLHSFGVFLFFVYRFVLFTCSYICNDRALNATLWIAC